MYIRRKVSSERFFDYVESTQTPKKNVQCKLIKKNFPSNLKQRCDPLLPYLQICEFQTFKASL